MSSPMRPISSATARNSIRAPATAAWRSGSRSKHDGDARKRGSGVFACDPAIPGASKEWGELTNRLGVLVFFPNRVRIRTAPPPGESNDVPRRIFIDEKLMRDEAVKALHVRPDLACEPKPFFFRAGFEPGIPNDGDHLGPSFESPRQRISIV